MSSCPQCGRANPDDARFCNGCGRPIDDAASAVDRRRTVTIVFCDVTGSTELGERLDPESLRSVMARYFATMRSAIERHGGTVEKFIGDAVMAVFGVPALHEDDAARAARAACEMRDAIGVLNDDLDRDHGVSIAIRIGINTGEVLATGAGAETLVTGDAVNVAARLETAAMPGEILIGESTRALLDDAKVEPASTLALKGKSSPVTAYRLNEIAGSTAARALSLRSPMIGRDRELADLRRAFDRVVSDRACVLFTVLAPAGQGKSRLVEEFVESLTDRARVLAGRCPSYGEGITYLPAVEVIRSVLAGADDVRAALADLLADVPRGDTIAARLSELLGLSAGAAAAEEIHWAFRAALEAVAAERPLVVVFDDIQWAEPTFLDLVEHIADWSVGAPILIVCMARPELLEWRQEWAGGKPNAHTVLLASLDEAETGQLIGALVGSTQIPDDLRASLTTTADGNPLFVEQMLSMLIDDGLLGAAHGEPSRLAVPPTISALLASRLDRLTADERTVLETASVIGHEFRQNAAAALLAEDERLALDNTLARLLRKRLLRAVPAAGSQAFRFEHLLIRDTAYAGVSKARRADLHERLAAWLEDEANEPAEVVGYHLEQGCLLRRELHPTVHDTTREARAARLLAASGRRALGRDDVGAAVNLLRRACALIPTEDPERVTILADLGWGLDSTGDQIGAREVFEEALALATHHDDALLRAHVLARRIETLHGSELDRASEEDLPWMIDVFERYGDEIGLARAWRLSGLSDWNRGMAGPFEAGLLRGLAYATSAGDAHEVARTALDLSFVLSRGPTPIDDVVRRSFELIAQTETRAVEAYSGHSLGHLLCRVGDFDGARAATTSLREFLRETGQVSTYWFMAECAADIEAVAGDYELAVQIMSEGMARLADIDGGRSAVLAGLLAHWAYEAGDYQTAEREADYAVQGDEFLSRAYGLGVLARLRARAGAFDEAEKLGREAAAMMSASDMLLDRAMVMLDLGDALRVAGRLDGAREALSDALHASSLKGDLVGAERTRALLASLDS